MYTQCTVYIPYLSVACLDGVVFVSFSLLILLISGCFHTSSFVRSSFIRLVSRQPFVSIDRLLPFLCEEKKKKKKTKYKKPIKTKNSLYFSEIRLKKSCACFVHCVIIILQKVKRENNIKY